MEYKKYPRTYHLPFSKGFTSDDKVLKDLSNFEGKTIEISEKMDGENTTMYSDKYFARSIDSVDHKSRHYVKGIWSNIKHDIPNGWRICGENLYAKHSIFYDNLDSYFLVYSIWDENNNCLDVNETNEFCNLLGLHRVPVIKIELFNEYSLMKLSESLNLSKTEGFVIRNIDSFDYTNFKNNVAKFVRPNHVTSSSHWMNEKIVPNILKQK